MYDFAPQDAIINKAFRLACFINGNESTALKVLNSSLERLETAVAAQDKRLYYTPSARQASSRRGSAGSRYKVSLSESHLLQRLIYLSSEPYEILQERAGSPRSICEEDMIVHFLKHLVHITMKRNSFYVALGISRVLHDYTTSETIEINNAVREADRMRDEDYYRSRKRRIMKEIRERFGSLIGVYQGPRAEERFIIQERPGWRAGLVEQCLDFFAPWDTPCLIPSSAAIDNVSRFYSRRRDPDEEHGIEVDRFHALIHPDCYKALTQRLGLDHPRSRLQVPSFFLSPAGNGSDGRPSARRDLRSLDERELSDIRHCVEERATRRRAATRGLLRIIADGIELGQLDPGRSNAARINLTERANVVEVVTEDLAGKLLLATHLLNYDECESEAQSSKQSIILEGGQKLSITVSRLKASGDDQSLTVDILYQQTSPFKAVLFFSTRFWRLLIGPVHQIWRRSSVALKPALAFGLALTIAVTAYLYAESGRLTSGHSLAEADGQSARSTAVLPATSPRPPLASPPPRHPGGVKPGTSSQLQARRPSRRLRSQASMDQVDTEDESTRDIQLQDDNATVSLHNATRIFIQTSGQSRLEEQLQSLLAQRMQATESLTVTDYRSANAALAISVRRIANRRRGSRVVLTLRLVDAAGRVIWPPARTARSYSGIAEAVAAKAIDDLVDDIKK